MKHFSNEVVKDYWCEGNRFKVLDEVRDFLDHMHMYFSAIEYDQRFQKISSSMRKFDDIEINISVAEMIKRSDQLANMVYKQSIHFERDKNIISFLSKIKTRLLFPLKLLEKEIIRRSTSDFIYLDIYFSLFKKHFDTFKKECIYKHSTFREWDDIDDYTTLYDVLPPLGENNCLFYGALQFSSGWSFYSKMFKAKEFLRLYNLTIDDMKEDGQYYIIKALGQESLSKTCVKYLVDPKLLISLQTRKSKDRYNSLKTIEKNLSAVYEEETGLTIDNLISQHFIPEKETPDAIHYLIDRINNVSETEYAFIEFDKNGGVSMNISESCNFRKK